MPDLLHKLAAFGPFNALIVGDYMLDEHLYGAAERLSPDAPVPVLVADHTERKPGGAANVARCITALKGRALCVGVLGADEAGRALRTLLEQDGCDTAGLLEDPHRPTTMKRSMIGLAQHRHPQKMFRVDVESRDAVDDAMCERLLERVAAHLGDADVVCLEDYNKGVCCERLCARLIEMCRGAGKPLLVDPAAIADYGRYRGATLVTPNRSEAELATGLDTPIEATELHNVGLATRLLEELELEAVVLTLDRHGALLEERGREAILVPTVARSVYDVTGAGDVVLAALAAGRANGLTWLESVELANAAAGLEVEVFGAQPIPLSHVQRDVLRRSRDLTGKVRTIDELLIEIAVHRDAGRKIVFTNGCFDVIHSGHVDYLREAKGQGDVLIAAVNSDAQVRALKGEGRPVYPITDRLNILSELKCIDYLTVFDTPSAEKLLRMLLPDVYVKGGDYRPEEINEYHVVRELGLELRILAHRPGLGSTRVIERLAEWEGVRE